MFLDEPFVSVDEETAQGLRDLLVRLWREKPTTVLFVTHDSREALQLAQRVIVLSEGPATIRKDIPIDLSTAERSDVVAVDALRRRLFPALSSAATDLMT